jgi:hypothetical protein
VPFAKKNEQLKDTRSPPQNTTRALLGFARTALAAL